jgi:hypothetical protein
MDRGPVNPLDYRFDIGREFKAATIGFLSGRADLAAMTGKSTKVATLP